jgi:hypothetical protein
MPAPHRHVAVLPDPEIEDALATGGVLCHYVASDPAAAERFARWIEHCPGDLDAAAVIGYLSKVHDLLQPVCSSPAIVDLAPDRALPALPAKEPA